MFCTPLKRQEVCGVKAYGDRVRQVGNGCVEEGRRIGWRNISECAVIGDY